jgi:hypothetical protein
VALSRAQLVTEIGGLLGNVLSLAGLAPTDTVGALQEPINATLRAMGVEEANLASPAADLVPDKAEAQALAFARYFVLERAVDAVQDLTDISAGEDGGVKSNQTVQSLERQRDRALAKAESYGLVFTDGAALGYGGVFCAVGPC